MLPDNGTGRLPCSLFYMQPLNPVAEESLSFRIRLCTWNVTAQRGRIGAINGEFLPCRNSWRSNKVSVVTANQIVKNGRTGLNPETAME